MIRSKSSGTTFSATKIAFYTDIDKFFCKILALHQYLFNRKTEKLRRLTRCEGNSLDTGPGWKFTLHVSDGLHHVFVPRPVDDNSI